MDGRSMRSSCCRAQEGGAEECACKCGRVMSSIWALTIEFPNNQARRPSSELFGGVYAGLFVSVSCVCVAVCVSVSVCQ